MQLFVKHSVDTWLWSGQSMKYIRLKIINMRSHSEKYSDGNQPTGGNILFCRDWRLISQSTGCQSAEHFYRR